MGATIVCLENSKYILNEQHEEYIFVNVLSRRITTRNNDS